jgi:NDP-sugar pyrophosphorylase family protein
MNFVRLIKSPYTPSPSLGGAWGGFKYFAHPTAIIDDNCIIGETTKIWHFSHIMPGAVIGNNCNLRQNVVVFINIRNN